MGNKSKVKNLFIGSKAIQYYNRNEDDIKKFIKDFHGVDIDKCHFVKDNFFIPFSVHGRMGFFLQQGDWLLKTKYDNLDRLSNDEFLKFSKKENNEFTITGNNDANFVSFNKISENLVQINVGLDCVNTEDLLLQQKFFLLF